VQTDEETINITMDLARKMGKQPVLVKKDVPGFIVNRIVSRVLNTACWLVARGKASIEMVDAALKYKLGFSMGAFELLDYSGIDIFYSIFKVMLERGFKIHMCPLLEEKFKAGEYGVKSGKGFYTYPELGKYVKPEIPKELSDKVDPLIILAPAVNEATWLLSENVASLEDIDKACKLGLGYPRGIFEYADEYGIDAIVSMLENLLKESSWEEYIPHPTLKMMVAEGKLGRETGKGLIGMGKAKEIILTGDMISASDALKIGLVNRVVPPEKLESEVRSFALKLAEKPPLALATAKYAIQSGYETVINTGLHLESTLFGLIFSTKDAKEGLKAFFEKRKPKFKGE